MIKPIDSYFNKYEKLNTSQPSPLLKVGEVVNYYMLRLSPLGVYNLATVKEWLNLNFKNWILSEEDSKSDKYHLHIVILDSRDKKLVKDIIDQFMLVHFPKEERVRGSFGTSQFNFKVADFPEKAVRYLSKDGKVQYSDTIDVDVFEEIRQGAFKKFSKEEFGVKLDELKHQFKITKMSISEFMISFVKLKGLYRQPINMNYVYQLAISCQVNRDPEYAEQLVDEYLMRVSR